MNIVYDLLGGLTFSWINNVGVGECVFAIIVMLFIKQAEPIVRKIFGFDNAGSLGSALASGALLMSSMKTASNAIGKAKGGKSNGSKPSGSSSKPQPSSNANRNTTNINNTNSKTSPGASNSQQNPSNSNSNSSSGNGQGAPSGGGANANSQGGTSQNPGQGSSSQNGQPGNRNLNTDRNGENLTDEEKKQRRNDIIKKVAGAYVSTGFRVAGTAIGAFASDDPIIGGITGFGYGTSFGEGAKSLGGKAAGAGKKIANTVTRRKNLNRQTNNLIDEYNNLKSKTGWDDDLMYRQSEALLQVQDLSKVSNPNMRKYGETLHKYRQAFEAKYQAPNDMVLDAIDKIQTGELEKTEESVKRYTRKK